MTALGVGDHAGALALARPHADLARASLPGSYSFALIHMNAGSFDEALRWFDLALAHAPSHAPSLLGRAALLHRGGDHVNALDTLTLLLRDAAGNVEALTLCGAVLCSLNRAGDALRIYDEALRQQPNHPPALAGRGLLLEEQGATEAALADFEAARLQTPGNIALHAYCGRLQQRLGRLPAALAAFEAAIRNGGATPDLFCAQGLLLQKLGRDAAALDVFDAGLARNPDCAELHCNRGNALHARGDVAEALAAFEAALRLQPSLAQAALNRATLLLQTGRIAAAIEACVAISGDPALASTFPAEVACLHGAALQLDGRAADALPLLEAALDCKPDYPEALLNRANVLQDLGHLDAALAGYDAALARRPAYPEALSGRGVALKELGRGDEAMAAFDAALAARPAFADARNNRAGLRLLRGDFLGGFADYESRWARSNATPKALESDLPTWRGEPLAGRGILVFDEQGLGDFVQFCRYLPMLVAAGADVTFLCRASMHWLVAGLAPTVRVVAAPPAEAGLHFQCALMSLPFAFGTRLATIPAVLPYLQAEADRIAHWAGRLGGDGVVEFEVLGSVGKMVLAADDVADLHFDVVDDVDEMENPRAVGAADRHVRLHVAQRVDGLGTVDFDVPADEVVHDDELAREFEAGRALVVEVDAVGGLEFGEVAFVDVVALALEVGAEVTALAGALVPVEAEPFQAVVDDLHGVDGVAGLVGVLDAQDELAAVVPREEPVEQGGARPADVQKAGGRRGETDADGCAHGTGTLNQKRRGCNRTRNLAADYAD